MRQMVVARPFAGGYRTDVPDYALNPNECAYSQDLIYPFGIAQQRWGWSYDGTDADVADNLVGVNRSRYPLPERTVTITSDASGKVWVHNAAAAGTKVWDNAGSATTTWIPRCVYNGDLILCAQDGLTPLLRYAGSAMSYSGGTPTGGTGNWQMPAGSSTLAAVAGSGSATVWPATADKGAFASVRFYTTSSAANQPLISSRILSKTSTGLSLEGVRNAGSSSLITSASSVYILPVGTAWPAVPVWDAGTMSSVTSGSSTYDFYGETLVEPGILTSDLYGDALLVINPTPGSNHQIAQIRTVTTGAPADILTRSPSGSSFSNTQYRIMRRLPFKDAAVHKNSLWGTGVKQYPNRVYAGPPLWNIGLPPGSVEPYDPTVAPGFADLDEFLLLEVDVPSRYDGDPVVALLPTPGPLLVLKGASVYGIYGTYPSYEQTILTTGAGCIDLRSAISVDGIAYWAGRDGVFMYAGGQIVPLSRGRIEREWQALMRGYVQGTSYVSMSVVEGHLVVSAGALTNTATSEAKIGPDASNPSDRTFIYDLEARQWTSRMSNARIRNMASVRVPGEINAAFAVSDDRQGRVIDLAPTITGTKCTNRASQTLADADSTDAAGTGPRLQAWSSASLAQASGIEGEARMMDMSIHTNLYDSGTPATASLAISTAHGEALNQDATTVVVHSPVAGDNTDRVDRSKRRINRTGRLHQLRVDLATTSATTKKTQIPEVTATFRDNRRMT
jgi:hypothetical protein